MTRDDDLSKRVERLENQVIALRYANLVLLHGLGQLAQGIPLTPQQLEGLRGQYRAITSITTLLSQKN